MKTKKRKPDSNGRPGEVDINGKLAISGLAMALRILRIYSLSEEDMNKIKELIGQIVLAVPADMKGGKE